jgi:molybdate transport system permease protein
VVETLVMLPLVMPPVATGLVLLKLLGRRGLIGGPVHQLWQQDIAFTGVAVVIALAVMSFPLLVRSARTAFEEVGVEPEEAAQTLGARPWTVWWHVTLPLARHGLLAGALLAFARALGEFGATILVAGNIPGETQTLALALYQEIQLGNEPVALHYVLWSGALALGALGLSQKLSTSKLEKNRELPRPHPVPKKD